MALSVHVVYFTREIGAFIDAMEATARRLCVIVAVRHRGQTPLDLGLWETLHGEPHASGPEVYDLLSILAARGRQVEVRHVDSPVGGGPQPVDDVVASERSRYLVAGGSPGEQLLRDGLVERFGRGDGLIELPRRERIATV